MRVLYWVWRRELAVTLRAPIAYVIGGLFLAVQGIAFAGLVSELSDTRQPAPLGALLERQLAGTLLIWLLHLVVLTLLGMRAVADERRSGGWESLVTAGISESTAVVGKWLAASTMYALLWLPTLSHLGVVAVFRSDPGGWDIASLLAGYAGAIAVGAALLAWPIAASAASSSMLAAGALGFAFVVGLFFVGELPSIGPDIAAEHRQLARVLELASLRGTLSRFARGELDVAAIVQVVGLAVTGLSLAIAVSCVGRRRRREIVERMLATALVAGIAIVSVILSVQHPLHIDVSADRRNSIDPMTRAVVAELTSPATLTIIAPTLGGLEPLYAEVTRVAHRMAEIGPLTVRTVDPALIAGGLDAAARLAGLQAKELAQSGGIVVEIGDRRKIMDVLELATFDGVTSGAPGFGELTIERAISGALAELSRRVPVTICAATGHGEMSVTAAEANGSDWVAIGNRLRGDGITVVEVAPSAALSACAALIVAGPTQPWSASEALAVQAYVRGGGGLVVAAASRRIPNPPGLAATGLEGVLATEGLGLPIAIAVDPSLAVREIPGALMVVNGYASHELNRGFVAARRTLWFQPRVVSVENGATPLISASPTSWGERDLEHGPPEKTDTDLRGPVALAALGSRHRVIALGSAESMSSAALIGGASAADLWMFQAVKFVAGQKTLSLGVKPRSVGQVRLAMTADERRIVIALSVVGIPMVWLICGGAVVAWRRRSST